MKVFILFLLFFSLNVAADAKCARYELKGEVKRNGPAIILITADKSLSQKTYHFELTSRPAILPYVGNFVTGVFTLKGEDKIVEASSIKDAVFNPVSGEKVPSVKKLKDVSCPQF